MQRRPFSAATLIAILAWLANALLPLAHAAMPASASNGGPAWCGPPSQALAAAYSALPGELRQALANDEGPLIEDCERACGLALQALLPDAGKAVTVVPAQARLQASGQPADGPLSVIRARPPTRGPPQG